MNLAQQCCLDGIMIIANKGINRVNYLYTGKNWDMDTIHRIYDECEKIAQEELNLTYFPNLIEIIDYEQMIDLYASVGMPVMYNHWSFGKRYLQNYSTYQKGYMGLALEMVINTNPCINYLLDENTATGQALVIAHAGIGHNSFFKNNYLFKQWTSPDFIIDYLVFAKKYIENCEEKYGQEEVERILDAAHALQNNGVDKYKKPRILSPQEETLRKKQREEEAEKNIDEIWNLVPTSTAKIENKTNDRFLPHGPEENLLYFLEKNSPILKTWQREILRIVRKINQYFYPQMFTKVINEGWASTVHYYIMNRFHEKGLIDDGSMLEFLQLHTSVVAQPDYDDRRRFSGFNPYHLGFSIFKDIKRISENPTDEDREWHPDIAGGDWKENWRYAYENFRDESFIQQFLSPNMIREMKLFEYVDDSDSEVYMIDNVHNERGYRNIRKSLANSKSLDSIIPDIQVTGVDFDTRTCFLSHYSDNGLVLDVASTRKVLKHFGNLWGFKTVISSIDRKSGNVFDAFSSDMVI